MYLLRFFIQFQQAIHVSLNKSKFVENKKKESKKLSFFSSDYGNRTRVPCVRGMCPNP